MKESEKIIDRLGQQLLEIGTLLLSSGANTNRIRMTVGRIALAYGYDLELLVTHRALMLTLSQKGENQFFSLLKRSSPHGVNFKLLSGISRMSWKVVEEKWTLEQIHNEVKRLGAIAHYPRWQVLLLVGLAGASFCRLFGGHYLDMGVAFVATISGLFVRQEALKFRYNPYLCVFFASLISSLISGLAVNFNLTPNPEFAFATSVLYLVPGVPLINSFSDLIDGNTTNGIVRGVNGLIISFAIALGMLTTIILYKI